MLLFKKLIPAIPFLLLLAWFCLQLNPLIYDSTFLLALDTSLFIPLLFLLISLILTALFFVLFASLASDPKIVLPVSVLASTVPLLFLSSAAGLTLTFGLLITLTGIYFLLRGTLSSYITFKAATLLTPSIKQVVTLILLASAIAFYLSASAQIKENGFKLPDQLFETALNFIPQQELPQAEQTGLPSISPEQIRMLEQNPQLLKQYGLDPVILETAKKQLNQSPQKLSTADLVKPMLEIQMQKIIEPYESFIPLILAAGFFFTLQSLASLLAILLPPILWVIFFILDKTGFTKYETETREVKKLVV